MQVVQQLVKQLDTKKKELADFQEKYKIRIRVCLLQMWRLLGTHACFHHSREAARLFAGHLDAPVNSQGCCLQSADEQSTPPHSQASKGSQGVLVGPS